MIKSRIFYLLPILVFLSLTLISAQTLVAGKIYDTNYNNIITNANIHVTCNASYLDTISLNDGSYLVAFNDTECTGGDTIDVTASKSGFDTETESGVLAPCTGASCTGIYFTIINVILDVSATPTTDTSSGGGGSSRFYLCGNGICDSGETIITCAKDCTPDFIPLNYKTNETEEENNGEETEETQDTTGLFSRITGGVIGVATSVTGIIVLIFVLALCGVFVVKRRIKKSKTE